MKNTKRVLAFLVGAAMMMPMVSAESANEYEATAQGFGGPVTVKITVDGGKVTAATITGDKETETIGGAAIKMLTEKLIGVSSADEVDAVASATVTPRSSCMAKPAAEDASISSSSSVSVTVPSGRRSVTPPFSCSSAYAALPSSSARAVRIAPTCRPYFWPTTLSCGLKV